MINCVNENSLGFSDAEPCSISSQSLLNKRKSLLHEVDFEHYWFTAYSVTNSPLCKRYEVLGTNILKFWNRNNDCEVLEKTFWGDKKYISLHFQH